VRLRLAAARRPLTPALAVDVCELSTARLLLRQWRAADREPWARLNGDAHAMRFYPSVLDRAASDALADRFAARLAEQGWGLWAVELRDGAPFIGSVGLNVPTFNAHFMPAVEVGWRLLPEHWGNGYATEAARFAVRFGFERLGLDEVVSFTTSVNEPSRRVMERLGMTHDPADDFDHPALPDWPLRRHVLYRLRRPGRPTRHCAPTARRRAVG
jgi:RimJ/RimL family protein N-acetyltransferase